MVRHCIPDNNSILRPVNLSDASRMQSTDLISTAFRIYSEAAPPRDKFFINEQSASHGWNLPPGERSEILQLKYYHIKIRK